MGATRSTLARPKALLALPAWFLSALLGSSSDVRAEPITAHGKDTYYLGIGNGTSVLNTEARGDLGVGEDRDFALRLYGGYRFGAHWAGEVYWAELGQARFNYRETGARAGSIGYQALGASTVYRLPIDSSVDLFGTVGVGHWSNSFNSVYGNNFDGNFLHAGGGAIFPMSKNWELRAEYGYYSTNQYTLLFNLSRNLGAAKRTKLFSQNKEQAEPTNSDDMRYTAATQNITNRNCEDFRIEFEDIRFEVSSAKLNDTSKRALDELASRLVRLPKDVHFELRGYADDVGTLIYNDRLSLVRARAVRNYLSTQGIPLGRMDAQGYGEWQLEQNSKSTEREHNRRVELVLVGTEKYITDGACSESPKVALSVAE